jgi:hypothetical protein
VAAAVVVAVAVAAATGGRSSGGARDAASGADATGRGRAAGAVALVVTYEGLRRESLRQLLLTNDLGCVVLDEGQRIRNPDTEVALLFSSSPFLFERVEKDNKKITKKKQNKLKN